MAKQPHPYERSALPKGGVIKRFKQSSKKHMKPKPDKNAVAALRLLSFRHAEILTRPELYIPPSDDESSTTSSASPSSPSSPSTSPSPSRWQVQSGPRLVDPVPSTSPLCAPVMPPLASFQKKKPRKTTQMMPSRAVSSSSGDSTSSSLSCTRTTPTRCTRLRPLQGPLPQAKPLPLAPSLAPHLSRMTRPIKIVLNDRP